MQVDNSSRKLCNSFDMNKSELPVLPNEVVNEILNRCAYDVDTFTHFSLVNKEWNSLVVNRRIHRINTHTDRFFDIPGIKSVDNIINFSKVHGAKILNLGISGEFSQIDFFELVSYLPNLSSLRFRGCSWLSDEDIGAVAWQTNLIDLDLSLSKITDTAISQLIDLNKLTTLDLSYCDISCEGFLDLPPHENLSALNLRGSEVTDQGLEIIAKVFPNLTDIDLYDCHKITDSGVLQLSVLKSLSRVAYRCQNPDETIEDFLNNRNGHIRAFYKYKDNLYIKGLDGKTLTIYMKCSENTAENLKKVVEKMIAPNVRLIFAGKQIESFPMTLDQYKIHNHSTLHAVLRLGGD